MKDATSAVANVDDYNGSAQLLAATTLRYVSLEWIFACLALSRNVLGTKNLGDILSERESIALEMQVYVQICRCIYWCHSFHSLIATIW